MKKATYFQIISTLILFCVSIGVHAQTYISGHITSNTTWTKVNSPYIVLDTVFVDPGLTLTIEPGVTVKVENGKPIKFNKSNLIAEGTLTDSIIFTTNYPIVSQGNWAGIYIYPDNNYSIFINEKIKYCRISHAAMGLQYSASGSFQDTVLIKHCNFSYNTWGLYISDVFKFSIDSCVFLYNTNAGLHPNNSRFLTIKNCNFDYNLYGISIGGYLDDGIIVSCSIRNSTYSGFAANVSSFTNSSIKSCIINQNYIGVDGGYDLKLVNCTIDSNRFGVNTTGLSYILGCTIRNNQTGISNQSGTTKVIISKNIIENDSIGIYIGSYDSIFCNKICNNYIYNVQVNGPTPNSIHYNLKNNDWCTTDTALISASIFDGHDDNFSELVDFLPLDTVQCYQSPCNLVISESTLNASCPTCADGRSTANVLGGFAPYIYSWNSIPAQTLHTAVNLLPGQYSVCATDVSGCSVCDTFNVYSGNCSAYFNFYPDTIPHSYLVQNLAHGSGALTYSWDWGDGSPNDVNPTPSHIYSTPGFYIICLTITDATGCVNSYCNSYNLQRNANAMIYVSVIGGPATGISENTENDFVIYPNPATDAITLLIPKNKNAEVRIYDLLGKIVFSSIISTTQNTIDISDLCSGIHIIELSYKSKIIRRKFMKL